ncbi:Senescence regulator [Carex littledalei]|uniref:Senescence regulator n=1 Tax=Carex littledalei TaxID=544730 RepID=A0A833R2E6_9POAL|nr:Senescence regulator [Carex littledalei]
MDRHRTTKSFNPNRFRSLLISPSPSHSNSTSSFELNESDLFASSPDRSDGPPLSPPIQTRTPNPNRNSNPIAFSRRTAFTRPPEGILAALPSSSSVASASSSPSSSSSSPSSARMIPAIPKPRREFPQAPQYQSAPVNVPVIPARFKNRKDSILHEEEEEDEKSDEEEMLPPHEVVDRARARDSPMTTFSVLEGAGRTLKGRDLRQVRNAIWRKTGFLD